MKKILLSSAIRNESIYKIDNNGAELIQPYYYSINGRIKFLSLKKIKLNEYELEGVYSKEFLDNQLVLVELEYMNLNKGENHVDIFEGSCKLVDLDDFSFKVVLTNRCGILRDNVKEIYKIFNIELKEDYVTELIPKIKYNIKLFFLVPDEETDYYFKITNGNIEEI